MNYRLTERKKELPMMRLCVHCREEHSFSQAVWIQFNSQLKKLRDLKFAYCERTGQFIIEEYE